MPMGVCMCVCLGIYSVWLHVCVHLFAHGVSEGHDTKFLTLYVQRGEKGKEREKLFKTLYLKHHLKTIEGKKH